MDKDKVIGGLEELAERNVGFRFLCNRDQAGSSAMLFLQWCLAPQVVKRLKDAAVTDARVFVTVTDPHLRETRYVFPLTSPQELIEFHCPGTHIVSGAVVYCPVKNARDAKRSTGWAAKKFLKKDGRYSYEYGLDGAISYNDCELFGEAYLPVEVADGFFAPPLSAREDWWINLWFGEPAWDQCEIRRRRMIAYTVQPIPVAAWAIFLFLLRFVVAFYASVMELRKGVPWSVLVHPFSAKTDDIRGDSTERWKGRPFANLLKPINQIFWFAFALFVSRPVMMVTGWPPGMAIVFCYIILMGAVVALIGGSSWLDKLPQPELDQEDLDRLYADLYCTTVPQGDALRAKRRGLANNLVLRFHDFKASVCRPTARG
jgi:hypothetical protein